MNYLYYYFKGIVCGDPEEEVLVCDCYLDLEGDDIDLMEEWDEVEVTLLTEKEAEALEAKGVDFVFNW